jgi:DNA-binding NarL/FixJ family response regulator
VGEPLEFTRISGVDDMVGALGEAASFDVVLFDLEPAESRGLGDFVRLHAMRPELPIVVSALETHEATALKAVQVGAEDYLIEDRIHPTLLVRCLQHAVERNRMVNELGQRARAWEAEWQGRRETTASTAEAFGTTTLHATAPDLFDALVTRYEDALDAALSERVYRVDEQAREKLRDIANELGFLRAGPRDVVEIHTTALRAKERSSSVNRFESYLDTSRTTVLELMGYLVTHYRRYSLGFGPADGPRARDAHATQRRRA